jgi:hypothetical protein
MKLETFIVSLNLQETLSLSMIAENVYINDEAFSVCSLNSLNSPND